MDDYRRRGLPAQHIVVDFPPKPFRQFEWVGLKGFPVLSRGESDAAENTGDKERQRTPFYVDSHRRRVQKNSQ